MILLIRRAWRALKGKRSVLFHTLAPASLVLLEFAAGVDWKEYLSPTHALIAYAATSIALRVATTTPIGRSGDS